MARRHQGRRQRHIPERRRHHARVTAGGLRRSRKFAVATVRTHGGRLRRKPPQASA